MSKTTNSSFDALSPYICKAGKQNTLPWKNKSRKIYDHEFIYCTKGRAYIILEERKYDLVPGSLILIKPDIPHNFWKDENDPGEQLWIHFDFFYRNDVYNLNQFVQYNNELLFQDILPQQHYIRENIVFENAFSFPEFIQVEKTKLIQNKFKKIIYSFEQSKPMWQLECKIYFLQILFTIINQLNNDNNYVLNRTSSNILDTVVQYICKNYARKLTLNEISSFARINADYLGRIFKKEFGMTIMQFVTHLRLQKAKELLLKTDLTVENISEIVGYNDVSYFSKVMKKNEGLSPSNWRKNYIYQI